MVSATTLRRGQRVLTVAWLVLVIPSVVWWRNSVPWLVFMSVWANVAAHAAGWIGARAEESNDG